MKFFKDYEITSEEITDRYRRAGIRSVMESYFNGNNSLIELEHLTRVHSHYGTGMGMQEGCEIVRKLGLTHETQLFDKESFMSTWNSRELT